MDVLQSTYRPIELLRYTGLFLWFCAGIPLLLMYWIFPEPLSVELYIAWIMLYPLFGMMYWNLVQSLPEYTATSNRLMYLSLLTASALGITAVSQTLLGGMLLLIVSVVLPWLLNIVPAVSWLIAQNILLTVIPQGSIQGIADSSCYRRRNLLQWWAMYPSMVFRRLQKEVR